MLAPCGAAFACKQAEADALLPCFTPVNAWLFPELKTPNGKAFISFEEPSAQENKYRQPIKLPCGKCDGCRIDRSRQWATRCFLEASLHNENCFVTLTYRPEFLPKNGTLIKRDLQLFLKRLRRKFGQKIIRYFACGEYGEKKMRPHYHICIFGFDFPKENKQLLPNSNPKYPLYQSADLFACWGKGKGKNFKSYGHSSVGSLTWESAAYTARYIMKKVLGDRAAEHYKQLIPEFNTMSLKPAIAHEWLKKYHSDVYPDDFVVLPNGQKQKTPKFFDKKYELLNPDAMSKIREKRKQFHEKQNLTQNDLNRMAECKRLQFAKLIRNYENET